MVEASWDGWEEENTPAGVSRGGTSSRYVWHGTFEEKSDSDGRKVMVPYCGKCNVEVTMVLRDFAAKCPHCLWDCWMGRSRDFELRSALISAFKGLSVMIKNLE
ncbi:hypothetical protein XELAEV_18025496mg [Xenopus laevis]|uniref:Uncharacterized protein n=1 Tax=Xenopus laevis TaxID=8355 RepID=A0A974D2G1_XENLA|nr:hypothetical protein XELAEV_18025496mg [Xenopus laevis]